MKKSLAFAAAFALLASTQAFAIFGVGAHYVHNMGAALKGEKETVFSDSYLGDITLTRDKVSDLQGLGFKLWIDLLPYIDIEATLNIAATRYTPYLGIPDPVKNDTIIVPLEIAPGAPFNLAFPGKASPLYGVASGDLSITYPFDVIPVISPYVGAGLSYMFGMPLMNKKFVEPFVETFVEGIANGMAQNPGGQPEIKTDELTENLVKALKDADYTKGFGAHLIAGIRAKAPIIPIALYANTKYYFGGGLNDKFSQGAVFELGGGFAI